MYVNFLPEWNVQDSVIYIDNKMLAGSNFPVVLPTSNASRWFWSWGQMMKSFFSTLVLSFLKYMTCPKILLPHGSWRLFGTCSFPLLSLSFSKAAVLHASDFGCVTSRQKTGEQAVLKTSSQKGSSWSVPVSPSDI